MLWYALDHDGHLGFPFYSRHTFFRNNHITGLVLKTSKTFVSVRNKIEKAFSLIGSARNGNVYLTTAL